MLRSLHIAALASARPVRDGYALLCRASWMAFKGINQTEPT